MARLKVDLFSPHHKKTTSKSKSNQSTVNPDLLSKPASWEHLTVNPSDDVWRKKLINTMYFWAEDPKSIEIQQFCIQYRIFYDTLQDWVPVYEDFAKAYRRFKLMIAANRRMGSVLREFDKDCVHRDMHIYDPEYQESINKEEESKAIPAINLTACLCKPKITSAEEMRKQYESIE